MVTARESAPGVLRVADIDLAALRANLLTLLLDDDFVLDARADAYGHGASLVVPLALEFGVRSILVSTRDSELAGVPSSVLTTVPPAGIRARAATSYGLDGQAHPVMTLRAEVVAVKAAEPGAGVSYGYSYRTPGETTLLLVGLGYADGVPRLASNRSRVFVGGGTFPLVGRIAMDQFVVDLGGRAATAEQVAVGDEVVLFGSDAAGHPLARDWASATRRTALELTANLGWRIRRTAHE